MKLILRSHKSSFQLFNYVADVTETSYWHWDDVVFLQGNSIFEAIKTMQQYHLFPIHLDTKIFGLIQFFFVLHCMNDFYIVISVILFHTIFMAWMKLVNSGVIKILSLWVNCSSALVGNHLKMVSRENTGPYPQNGLASGKHLVIKFCHFWICEMTKRYW